MDKYLRLLRFELKNLIRDSMTFVMIVYPLMMVIIGSFVIPAIIDVFGDGGPGERTASLFVLVVLTSVGPFIGAAMLGFNLLDHRDENTLDTIRVTPLSLRGYMTFKALYAYAFSAVGTVVILMGVKLLAGDNYTVMGENLLDHFTAVNIVYYALVAGLFTPVFAFFLAAVSKNKIEGFAFMKASGMIIIVPVLSLLEALQNYRQYFLGLVPNFWPLKGFLVQSGLLDHTHNLPGHLYMIIGILYMGLLIYAMYRIFDRAIKG